ncbi:MAG: hypothetical protein ABSF56_00960 [Minisyncoccia bacterium]|jgi:beta-lactamase superfamily II metal-dependent hydrolase
MIKGASKPLLIFAAGAAALSGTGLYAWHESRRPAVLELFVFDLPGAPAVFIRTPNDKRILIDGGSNAEVIRRLTKILPFYSRRIDSVVATAADGKNVTGLIEALNRYSVDKAIIPDVTLESLGLASSSDPIYRTFIETIDLHHIPVQKVLSGDRLVLDRTGIDSNDGVTADTLFPVPADRFNYSKASVPEIVMRIEYGSTSVALLGGAGVKIQKFVATENQKPADAVVISQSATASNVSAELVDSMAPDFLLYSQQIMKSPKKPPAAAKKKAAGDPLAGITDDRRFNVRKTGTVKIVSDGMHVGVSNQ